jgi:hypothetical protein
MKKWSMFLVIALAIGLLPGTAQSEGSFKGYMFGEYYYVINHHNPDIESRHGFWFRRIYFTYNNGIAENIKMRLRIELNSPGDFTSGSSLTPVLKDACLSYKTGGQEVKFGIISTPTWGNIENFWGYRSLEKTPLDLQKMGSSRDFGIGFQGNFDGGKKVSYNVMFGNGASNKGETDAGKKFYGSLAFKPADGLIIEAYGDYESKKDDKTYYVYQGFVGYGDSWGRIGAMYARRHFKQEIAGTADVTNDYDILSVFAVVKASEKVDIIARYDRSFGDGFEQNYSGNKISYVPFADDPGAPFNLLIGAISLQAAKNVWLIPNVKYVFYGEPGVGAKPSEDVYANMTVFFKF